MQTRALKGVARGLKTAPEAQTWTILPGFLVSAISRRHLSERPLVKAQRSYISYDHHSQLDSLSPGLATQSSAPSSPKGLPPEAYALLSTRQKNDVAEWIAIIDLYLPYELRSTAKRLPSLDDTEQCVLSIESLPDVLDRARKVAQVDLLSYMGIHENRWPAALALMKKMLDGCPSYSAMVLDSERLPEMPWSPDGRKLDEMTSRPISVRETRSYTSGILTAVGKDPFNLDNDDSVKSRSRRQIGQIWRALGSMILQAEDSPVNDPSHKIIMSNVMQMLADMHHISVLPDSIYNYEPPDDHTVIQRPPTLYLLSARIMTALSDVAWKSHWKEEMAKAQSYGYDLPPPRVQPQLPYVGAEIWLEFVLWACIEGGWINEAMWIIFEMESRRENPSLRWSTISWDEICAAKKPQLSWTAVLKLQIDRSRLNQATGIGIANNGISSVDMGRRTISREVVLALMDGLTNSIITGSGIHEGRQFRTYVGLKVCKRLLERNKPPMDAGHLNGLILRSAEASNVDLDVKPSNLQQVLALRPKLAKGEASATASQDVGQMNALDPSAAILGLLHRALGSFARHRNLQGALEAFKQIQDVIDTNRAQYIQEFADDLRHRLQREPAGSDSNRQSSPLLYPEIPNHVIEAFLDLIIVTKTFNVGEWLLFNDDIDGGALSPALFAEPNLQPVLLRFATATLNDPLLAQVLRNLAYPLSEATLHALLHCQVALAKWDAVEGSLRHLGATNGMSCTDHDVMYIAAAIVKLGRPSDVESNTAHMARAQQIFRDVVDGRYDYRSGQDRSLDTVAKQHRNQLRRICSSGSFALKSVTDVPEDAIRRTHYSTEVPADAFNILLEAIVEAHGTTAGISFWKQWCTGPDHPPFARHGIGSGPASSAEKVVRPSWPMLHTILRPAVQDLTALDGTAAATRYLETMGEEVNEDDADRLHSAADFDRCLSAFQWAMAMSKRFDSSGKAPRINLSQPLTRYLQRKGSLRMESKHILIVPSVAQKQYTTRSLFESICMQHIISH